MTKTERIESEVQKHLEKLHIEIEQIIGYEPGTKETEEHLKSLLSFYWERVEEDFQSMESESKEAYNPDYPAHLRAEQFKRLVAELKQMESKILFRIGPFEIRRMTK